MDNDQMQVLTSRIDQAFLVENYLLVVKSHQRPTPTPISPEIFSKFPDIWHQASCIVILKPLDGGFKLATFLESLDG